MDAGTTRQPTPSVAAVAVQPMPTHAILQTVAGGELTIFPHVVEFKDVEPDRTYSMIVRVQNTSSRSRRIRVIPPANKCFRVRFGNDAPVAPGIEVACEIIFSCTEISQPIVDALLVRGDGGAAVRIGLHAFPPMPTLDILPQDSIDFGTIVVGQSVTRSLEVVNSSFTMPADVSVTIQGEGAALVSVSPANFHLDRAVVGAASKPNSRTLKFNVKTTGADEGECRLTAVLEAPGLAPRSVPLIMRVTEHIIQLRDKTGDAMMLSQPLQVGTVFFGAESSTEVELFNDGPDEISFSFGCRDGVPELAAQTGDDNASVTTHGSVITAHAAIGAKKDASLLRNASVDASLARITSVKNPPLNPAVQELIQSATMLAGKARQHAAGTTQHAPAPAAQDAFGARPPVNTGTFSILPREGVVAPGGKVRLKVLFRPRDSTAPPSFKAQASLAFNIDDQSRPMTDRNEDDDLFSGHASGPTVKQPKIPALEDPTRAHGHYFAINETLFDNPSVAATMSGGRQSPGAGEEHAASGNLTGTLEMERLAAFQARSSLVHDKVAALKPQSGYQIACSTSTPSIPAETFVSTFTCRIPELELELPFIAYGIAERALAQVSTHSISFGNVLVDGRRDARFTISSHVRSLPLRVAVGKVANVYAEPDDVLVPAGGRADVLITLQPTKLGDIIDTVPIFLLPAGSDTSVAIKPPALKSRVYDTAAAMEEIQARLADCLAVLPLRLHASVVVNSTPAVDVLTTQLDGLATRDVIELARTLDQGAHSPRSPQAFQRSQKFRDRIAHAPKELYEPRLNMVDSEHDDAAPSPRGSPRPHAVSSPSKHIPMWAKVAATRGLAEHDVPSTSKYSFTFDDLRTLTAHKQAYVDFLRTSQKQRTTAHGKASNIEQELGLSNIRTELRAPMLDAPGKLEMLSEPVWLKRPVTLDGKPKPRIGGNAYRHNPDKLVKTKFKDQPTTQAEKADCTAHLSDEELTLLSAGPSILDFGRFNVFTPTVKNFSVVNDLPQTVHVALDISPESYPELIRTHPKSQVIPSGGTAGFDVVFYTEQDVTAFATQGQLGLVYQKFLQYIINGQHRQKIAVQAEVLPIELRLSKTELYHRFSDTSLAASVTEYIELRNEGTASAKFRWETYVSEQNAMHSSTAASSLISRVASRRPTTALSLAGPVSGKRSAAQGDVPSLGKDAPPQFAVAPMEGCVEPNGVIKIAVSYTPVLGGRRSETFRLIVDGGAQGDQAPNLMVSGEEHDPLVRCSDAAVDFGKVALGLSREHVASFTNAGSTPAVFWINGSLPPCVSVSPMEGRLDPGESCDVTFALNAQKPFVLDPADTFIDVGVRGGASLKLPVAASVILPDVSVLESEIDFGGVTMGGFARRRLTLVNRSPIATEVSVDLSDFPQFFVAPLNHFSGDRDDVSIGEESMFQAESVASRSMGGTQRRPSSRSLTKDSGGKKSVASLSPRSVSSPRAQKKSTVDDEGDEEEEEDVKDEDTFEDVRFSNLPRKLKVKLNADATLPFEFVFRPTSGKAFDFELPVTLVGPGKIPELQRRVTGRGLEPRVKLEPGPVVDFEYRVVLAETARRIPYTMNFRIRNVDKSGPVIWRADTSNLKPSFGGMQQVFSMEPAQGVIPVGGTTTVAVQFLPLDVLKDYSHTVPLYVLDNEEQAAQLETQLAEEGLLLKHKSHSRLSSDAVPVQPYLDIELRGTPIPPQLSFDVREVILPPVPLGVESRATFNIISNGYDHLELQHSLSNISKPDSTTSDLTSVLPAFPLTIGYPQGNVLSLSRPRLPVVVSFKSSTPFAATVFLHFRDAEKKRYAIPVSFTSDNSVLTVHSYLENKAEDLIYEGPGQDCINPVKLQPVKVVDTSRSALGSATAKSEGRQKRASGTEKEKVIFPVAFAIPVASVYAGIAGAAVPPPAIFPIHPPVYHLPSPASVAVLARWLNCTVFRTPVVNFPEDIIATHSKIVFDAVEGLTGQVVPGKLKTKVPAHKKERCMLLFNQSKELLGFLRSQGGMLSSVRPENLLSKDDFIRVRKYQHRGQFGPPFGANVLQYPSAAAKKLKSKLLAAAFPSISQDAWFQVMMQIVRAFVLPRVTLRALVALGGMVLSAETEDYVRYLFLREAALDAAWKNLDDKREVTADAVASSKVPSAHRALDAAASAVMGTATHAESFPAMLTPRSMGAAPTAAESMQMPLDGTSKPEAAILRDEGRAAAALRATVLHSAGPVPKKSSVKPNANIAATLPHDPSDLSFQLFDAVAHAAGSHIPAELNQLMAERARIQRFISAILSPDASLQNSNIYTTHELLLLRWLSYHCNRGCAAAALSYKKRASTEQAGVSRGQVVYQQRKVISYDHDLVDCTVWLFALISHSPELAHSGGLLDFASGRIHQFPKNNKEIHDNAVAFVVALRELHLEPPFTAADLCPDLPQDIAAYLAGTAGEKPLSARSGATDIRKLGDSDNPVDSQGLLSAAELVSTEPQNRNVEYVEPGSAPKGLFAVPPMLEGAVRRAVPGIRDKTASAHVSTGVNLAVAAGAETLTSVYSAKHGLLWGLWCFHNLPQLVPKTIIDFEGSAGTRITRSITLHNPTSRVITYDVLLEGSTDFSASTPSVRMEPDTTVRYVVTCSPRFAHPVHAKISFRTRREGALPVQSLVFALRSVVTARVPAGTKEVTCRTYSSNVFDVEVRNTLGRDATFDVEILMLKPDAAPGENVPLWHQNALQSSAPSIYVIPAAAATAALQEPLSLNSLPMIAYPPPMLAMPNTDRKCSDTDAKPESARKGKTVSNEDLVPPDKTLMPFWTRYTRIALKAGQSKRLPIQFAPLSVGDHRSALVLTDVSREVGELVMELLGRATPPTPLAHLVDKLPCPPDLGAKKSIIVTRLLSIPSINAQLESAEEALVDRYERAQRQEITRSRDVSRQTQVKKRHKLMNVLRSYGISSTRPGRVRGGNAAGGVIDTSIREYLKLGEDGKPLGIQQKFVPTVLEGVGRFFTVEIDSPFFKVPEQVFVPGPLLPITAALAASVVPSSDADTARADAALARAIRKDTIDTLSAIVADLSIPTDAQTVSEAVKRRAPIETLAVMIQPHLFLPSAVGSQRTFQAVAAQIAANTLGVTATKATLEMAAQLTDGIPDLSTPLAVGETLAFNDDDVLPLLSKLPVQLTVANPGVYRGRLTLTCGSDIRLYDIEIAVEANELPPKLLMNTTALRACTQLLPVVNTTGQDWVLVTAIEESATDASESHSRTPSHFGARAAGQVVSHHFSGPSKTIVPANQRVDVPITFAPPCPTVENVVVRLIHDPLEEGRSVRKPTGTAEGRMGTAHTQRPPPTAALSEGPSIVLATPTLEYHISASATKAEASDLLSLNAVTGQSTRVTVDVVNFLTRHAATFAVSSTLPFFAGPATVTVPPASIPVMSKDPGSGTGSRPVRDTVEAPADSRNISPAITPFGTPTASPSQSRRASLGQTTGFKPGASSYSFDLRPHASGVHQGQLVFQDDSGQQQWFAITIDARPPPPVAEVSLVTHVRKAVTAEIDVANPSDNPVTFIVEVLGEGLLGEAELTVPAKSSKPYEVLYAPLLTTSGVNADGEIQPDEGLVRFFSEAVGEVSYAFHLTALPADPIMVPPFNMPIGQIGTFEYILENPLGDNAVVYIESSDLNKAFVRADNDADFVDHVTVPAYGSAKLTLCYAPESLGALEECEIVLSSSTIGLWHFVIQGEGSAPTPAGPMHVFAEVGTVSPHFVVFHNPLAVPVEVTPQLEFEIGESTALPKQSASSKLQHTVHTALAGTKASLSDPMMLLDSQTFIVAPKASARVPFNFAPTALQVLQARVVLHGVLPSRARVVWQYPIECTVDAPVYDKITVVEAEVAAALFVPVRLPMKHFSFPPGLSSLRCNMAMQAANTAENALLHKFVSILPTKAIITPDDTSVELDFQLMPAKCGVIRAELVVTVDGVPGRWRFPLEFSFVQPATVPTLQVTAAVGAVSTVPIPMASKVANVVAYRASFTADSDDGFEVEPATGILAPKAEFTGSFVHFAPKEYGKHYKGRVLIQTDDFEWYYDVSGRLPAYVPPRTAAFSALQARK